MTCKDVQDKLSDAAVAGSNVTRETGIPDENSVVSKQLIAQSSNSPSVYLAQKQYGRWPRFILICLCSCTIASVAVCVRDYSVTKQNEKTATLNQDSQERLITVLTPIPTQIAQVVPKFRTLDELDRDLQIAKTKGDGFAIDEIVSDVTNFTRSTDPNIAIQAQSTLAEAFYNSGEVDKFFNVFISFADSSGAEKYRSAISRGRTEAQAATSRDEEVQRLLKTKAFDLIQIQDEVLGFRLLDTISARYPNSDADYYAVYLYAEQARTSHNYKAAQDALIKIIAAEGTPALWEKALFAASEIAPWAQNQDELVKAMKGKLATSTGDSPALLNYKIADVVASKGDKYLPEALAWYQRAIEVSPSGKYAESVKTIVDNLKKRKLSDLLRRD